MFEILTGWLGNDYLFWGLIVVATILFIRALAGIIISKAEAKADMDIIISKAEAKADMDYIMQWYKYERKIVTNDHKKFMANLIFQGDNEL
jgi:hypothetical protein